MKRINKPNTQKNIEKASLSSEKNLLSYRGRIFSILGFLIALAGAYLSGCDKAEDSSKPSSAQTLTESPPAPPVPPEIKEPPPEPTPEPPVAEEEAQEQDEAEQIKPYECEKDTTVHIEVINQNSRPANAPFQLKELQGAASMTCWDVTCKPKKKPRRKSKKASKEDATDIEKPEPIRKIQVAPPDKKDETGIWKLFYVVDGVVLTQIQIVPYENEPLDVFLKRAMTVLHMCSFNEQLCEEFDSEKAEDGQFPINPGDFKLRKVFRSESY